MSYGSGYDGGGGGLSFAFPRLTPAVKTIMIVCAVLQVAQLFAPQDVIADFCGLSAERLLENPLHGVLGFGTYMWVHEWRALGHLLFNMLGLWFFGSMVEEALGTRRFWWVYLACGVGGGILWVLISQLSGIGMAKVVGASGGVYGMIAYAAFLQPRARVILIIFPVMLMWLAIGLGVFAVYDMLIQLRVGGQGGTAHSAHVGGMLVGVLAFRLRGQMAQFQVQREAKAVQRKKDAEKAEEQELDRILAKIHEQGMSTLTKAERRFLETRSKNKS